MLGNFPRLSTFFLNQLFQKIILGTLSTRVSNSLDPDQPRPIVGHDLGPNCVRQQNYDRGILVLYGLENINVSEVSN